MENSNILYEISLKETQNIYLENLKTFDEFCKRQKLQYFAVAGTLLGAVRHEGFIPWDDDIDLGTTRLEFEKMEIFKSYGDLFFLTRKNYKYMDCTIMRVCLPGFYTYSPASNDPFLHFLPIDVFPLDFVPEKKQKMRVFQRRIRFYKKLIMLKERCYYSSSKPKRLAQKIVSFLLPPLKLLTYIFEKISVSQKMVDKSKAVYCDGYFSYGDKSETHIEHLSDYSSVIEKKFDGIEIPCPSGFNSILSGCYGPNYMTPIKTKSTSKQIYLASKEVLDKYGIPLCGRKIFNALPKKAYKKLIV